MKRFRWIWMAGILFTLGVAAIWMPIKDCYTEVDMATGSVRCREVQFGIFEREIRRTPGWIELRAKELGIAYVPDWQLMGHGSETLLMRSCGLGRHRHVAADLWIMEGCESEKRDEFLRIYLPADTETRVRILKVWKDREME